MNANAGRPAAPKQRVKRPRLKSMKVAKVRPPRTVKFRLPFLAHRVRSPQPEVAGEGGMF